MRSFAVFKRSGMGFALAAMALAAQGAESPGRTLMRYPTLYGNTVVFVAHDNLWSVPRTGGAATRLTADEGRDVLSTIRLWKPKGIQQRTSRN